MPLDLTVESSRKHRSYGAVDPLHGAELGVDFVPFSAWRYRRVVAR
ncbi:MAG: hypothetical protein ACJ76U_11600 [Gaiellaceae bacterium]